MFAFGVNSGAYVAEIIRGGIASIDPGQAEAGRSLGLSEGATMRLIVLPQAVKNILPALFNEFIALLKETSVAGYIAAGSDEGIRFHPGHRVQQRAAVHCGGHLSAAGGRHDSHSEKNGTEAGAK